jgi:glycosyltransferase involved in cell wall biosynthesis
LKICLIAVELFAWGKYGGFGRAARTIGRELARRGCDVTAVVPRRPGQREVERLDGITVHGFPPAAPWTARRLFERCDADVYHSCEPSLASWIAMEAMPGRRHVVTCRDPRDLRDWGLELARPSLSRLQVALNFLYEGNPLARAAVARADAVWTIARDLVPKVARLYGLHRQPGFLPTPIPIPARVEKATRPTVAWVARLDRRKRPELFVELARSFPEVRFVCVGRTRDPRWARRLARRASGIANLELVGFLDQFEGAAHGRTLSESWVFVNCATRESMPNSILEAAAHGCAILSHVDPGGFASRFGYHAHDDDFARGLAFLLEGERWRERGQRAAAEVRETFELGRAIDLHLEAYASVLGAPARRRGRARAARAP